MQVVLAMFRSDGERRSFSLHKDLTVIGRREDCDLRIPLGEISRKHCRLIMDAEGLRVEDLGSSNGTYHNGQRVQEAVIQPGDTIQLGSIAFVVQIDGSPVDEELSPVLASKAPAAASAESADADDSSTGGGSGSGTPLEDSASGQPAVEAAAGNGDGADADGFDPMAILDSGDSQGSQINVDPEALEIDLEESEHGQGASA